MKVISLALVLLLVAAAAAQVPPVKNFDFQNGPCNRDNRNCDWIVGTWKGIVTSSAASYYFMSSSQQAILTVNTPWAQRREDLVCLSREYEIPYECTFGYSESDDNLYQYCWFSPTFVDICDSEFLPIIDRFATDFMTPGFFMTNRIDTLENGIHYQNLETSVSGCLPYDVASRDLIIGNLWDGFSTISQCPSFDQGEFGNSPVLPSSCEARITTTTTQSTTTTTAPPTTTTTTTTAPSTTTSTTTSTTSTTSTTTSTTSTTSTTTTTPSTTTTSTTSTTTTTSEPDDADYGCAEVFEGENAVYGFQLWRQRPASFPDDSVFHRNECNEDNNRDCSCDRDNNACNWLVGRWGGYLFAKGYNAFDRAVDLDDPIYPFPLFEEDVRCQFSESATPFTCAYYYNEESDLLNSHCWYSAGGVYPTRGGPSPTFAWEQWREISSIRNGLSVSRTSSRYNVNQAVGGNDGTCVPYDRFDSDTFLMQFPDGFSTTGVSSCPASPNTVFQCRDGSSAQTGNNNMFTLNYRIMDASWHDWDASASFAPMVGVALILAALLALF